MGAGERILVVTGMTALTNASAMDKRGPTTNTREAAGTIARTGTIRTAIEITIARITGVITVVRIPAATDERTTVVGIPGTVLGHGAVPTGTVPIGIERIAIDEIGIDAGTPPRMNRINQRGSEAAHTLHTLFLPPFTQK